MCRASKMARVPSGHPGACGPRGDKVGPTHPVGETKMVSRVHGAASESMWCYAKLSGPWLFPYAVVAGLTLSPTFLGFRGSFDLFLVIFLFFLSIEFACQFILVGFARVGWISVGARENRI